MPYCPNCGSEDTYPTKRDNQYKCSDCEVIFDVFIYFPASMISNGFKVS
jgi:transposase-like protein